MNHTIRTSLAGLAISSLVAACHAQTVVPDGPTGFSLSWEESFESPATGWITDETPGPEGWCGDIRVEDGGGPGASGGSGFALVAHGACNDFWTENGFAAGSGPYAPFGTYSDTWPEGGFVTELDIYLDPAWSAAPDGTVFTYAVSAILLDQGYPAGLRYFMVPVTRSDGALRVGGHPVASTGWYTFRHRFTDDNGALSVGFELLRDGTVAFEQANVATGLSEERTSSFASVNVGTGYAWLAAIREGLLLPIDDQELYTQR